MTERCQLLYLSRLAKGVSPACVADIVQASRKRNSMHGISSLLVFDGWRFCQYIEGASTAVGELAKRIRTDARHADLKVLHQSPLVVPLVWAGHSLVFALNYDDGLDRFERIRGAQAIPLLADLLPSLDIDPEFTSL